MYCETHMHRSHQYILDCVSELYNRHILMPAKEQKKICQLAVIIEIKHVNLLVKKSMCKLF
jgi:hypothetical protein